MLTDEQAEEIGRIDRAMRAIEGELAAMRVELSPYWEDKDEIDRQLKMVRFALPEVHKVMSTKFCGLSPQARKALQERTGEIREPGYFVEVEKNVVHRDKEGIEERKFLFEQSMLLSEEWGHRLKAWRSLKADLDALGRERDKILLVASKAKKSRQPRLL